MRRIGNNALTQVITLFTVFAVAAGFLLVTEPLLAASSAPKTDEFIEVVIHFLDKTEPALFTNPGDNRFPNPRMDLPRYFAFLGVASAGCAFYFSRLKAVSKDGSLEYKNITPIKLRI